VLTAPERAAIASLWNYVRHARSLAGVESMTLAIGKGLELSRFADGSAGQG